MEKKSVENEPAAMNPASISRFRKERFLLELSEDDFRDKVVRPLFLRRGLRDGRDTCGREEEGKDAVFVDTNRLGMTEIWVPQTKRGSLNMSAKANENTVGAATQLKTAINTKVVLLATKERLSPNYAVVCASGKINNAARKYIVEQVDDPRLRFMDVDDIVPMVDEYFPELWWGIDADRFPYLRKLREALMTSSDTISLAELDIAGKTGPPIADDVYIPLYLHRLTTKPVKVRGQVYSKPDVEQIPVQGVVGRRERLIHIVGEAGTGKTTALRRLAYTIADKAISDTHVHSIPIVLKCTQIVARDWRLLDAITEATLRYADSQKPCFTQDDLDDGNLLVLADALDEVPARDREKVVARLHEFHVAFPNCTVILASRNYSSITELPELNEFLRFNITPINLNQAQTLLERLSRGKGLPVEQANEILRQLHQVHGLDLNPLLVTVFAATSDYARRDIPANITELFKKFTEMMIGRWDQKKGLAQQYQAVVKDFLLKRLGFHMHSNNWRAIPLSNCKRIFSEELRERGYEADVDIVFDEVVYRSGLFRIEDGCLVFRHALLQEFFAGRGVPSPTFFETVMSDERWRHPIVFYFGEHPEAHADLVGLIGKMDFYEGPALYSAGVAVGLAVQACYLAKVSEKVESMGHVIKALSRSYEAFSKACEEGQLKYPLNAFLGYYLVARDAVACEAIKDQIFDNVNHLLQESSVEGTEVEAFWHFVSLIESGSLEKAEQLLRQFKPTDRRLLLALFLGCFLIWHLRVTCKDERKIAERICTSLGPRTDDLRKQVMDEMKSMLLEVRRGKVEALPMAPREAPEPKQLPKRTSPAKGRLG